MPLWVACVVGSRTRPGGQTVRPVSVWVVAPDEAHAIAKVVDVQITSPLFQSEAPRTDEWTFQPIKVQQVSDSVIREAAAELGMIEPPKEQPCAS